MRTIALVILALLAPFTRAGAAEPPRTLFAYVLFALNGLESRGLTLSHGAVGVNSGAVYSHGPILLEDAPLVADVVRIQPQSKCQSLFANMVARSGPDCGPPTNFAGPVLADPVTECGYPATFPDCTGAQPVTVKIDETRHLPPGVYGALDVKGGSRGGTLFLQGGTYTFCGAITTGRNTKLFTEDASIVQVVGDVTLGPSSTAMPTPTSPLPSNTLRMFVGGPHARFARGATVHGLFCAPAATLRITAESSVKGTFFAKRLRTEKMEGTLGDFGATSTSTSSTSTTSTTDPCLSPSHCGNGVVDCGETCDPTAAPVPCSAGGGFVACVDDCTRLDDTGCPIVDTTTTTGTTSTSTTTTTTTTDVCSGPAHCGDGVVDCGEPCDPAGPAVPCNGDVGAPAAVCTASCTVDTSACPTTTTTSPTTTTLPCAAGPAHCGNGIVDCGEVCDPGTATSCGPSGGTATCADDCTRIDTSACPPQEICGNCIDDDGNGLTDFEDPACCAQAQTSALVLRKARLKSHGATSALKLRGLLGKRPPLDLQPAAQPLQLQLRADDGEVFCAQLPAGALVRKNGKTFVFKNAHGTMPSAQGLEVVRIAFKRSGAVRLAVRGRDVHATTPPAGSLRVTVGATGNGGDGTTTQCSTVTAPFVTRRKGLRFP